MPKPNRRAESDPAPNGAPDGALPTIKELLSYRIHQVANALSRGAAARYRHEFGVSLMEWRTLALLGDFAPMTLKQLGQQAGLDKSLASRVVAGLVERGLVLREIGPEDAREVALRLSAAGRRTHEGLMRAARERDAAFLAALTEGERACLASAAGKLLAEAKRQAAPEAWSEQASRRNGSRQARRG
jgi:DNA-binding MarR family transcriptional regulator